MQTSRWKSRWLEAMLGIMMGVVLGTSVIAYLGAGAIYDYRDSVAAMDRLPQVEAIVVLSGGRGRIRVAGDLWHQYFQNQSQSARAGDRSGLPILYLSGLGRQAGFNVLDGHLRKEVLKDLMLKHVIIENESTNTEQNAQWLRRYQRKNNWKRILLVTSNYHMRRSKLILERILGPEVAIETFSVVQEPLSAASWRADLNAIRVTLTEYIKWLIELSAS